MGQGITGDSCGGGLTAGTMGQGITGDSCGGGLCTLLVQWDKKSKGTVVVEDCRLLVQWDKESQGTAVVVDCILLVQWDKESQGTVVVVDSVHCWYNGTRNHRGQLWWWTLYTAGTMGQGITGDSCHGGLCTLLVKWDKESQGTVVVVDSVQGWYNGTRNHRGQLWWWTLYTAGKMGQGITKDSCGGGLCTRLVQWDKGSQGTVVVVDSVQGWYNGTRNHRGQLWWWTHCWYNGTRNHRGQLWWWTLYTAGTMGQKIKGDSCGGGLYTAGTMGQGITGDSCGGGLCTLLVQWDKESQGTAVVVDSVHCWYNGTRNHRGQLWWWTLYTAGTMGQGITGDSCGGGLTAGTMGQGITKDSCGGRLCTRLVQWDKESQRTVVVVDSVQGWYNGTRNHKGQLWW